MVFWGSSSITMALLTELSGSPIPLKTVRTPCTAGWGLAGTSVSGDWGRLRLQIEFKRFADVARRLLAGSHTPYPDWAASRVEEDD